MTNRTNTALNVIRGSAGRYFGLETKNETINARFIGESVATIVVEDRNAGEVRRIAKSSITAVSFRGSRTVVR
jgi:hypothetical protein